MHPTSPSPVDRYRRESLPLLYQGLFTAIVRIQSGRQQIQNADGFRRRMIEALAEVGREAVKRGYATEHTIETDFAVAAFLDEAILNSQDPARGDWEQRPLQDELFKRRDAGEVFFARVEKLQNRPDSPELADMLEVYLLCLLLGFEGKYLIGERDHLLVLIDRLRQRIDRIRGASAALSPLASLPGDAPVAPPADPWIPKLRLAAMAAGGLTLALFILFRLTLYFQSSSLRELLARSLN